MKFQRYSSIENSYREKMINYIIMEGHTHGDWIVQEKIHGSHFSIWYNGKDLRYAKRSGFVGTGSDFYNFESVAERYNFEEIVSEIYKEIFKGDKSGRK